MSDFEAMFWSCLFASIVGVIVYLWAKNNPDEFK